MRLIVGTCRECAGTGNIPTDRFEETGELAHCHMCGGTGDLDSYRLMSAYEQGRDDALEPIRWALGQIQEILNEPAAMTTSRLKQVVGGGNGEPRQPVPGSPRKAGLTGEYQHGGLDWDMA